MHRAKVFLRGPLHAVIEVALKALRSVMNCISLHFTETQTAYELTVFDSDSDSLIATLERGLRYRKPVKDGAIPYDDLLTSDWSGV